MSCVLERILAIWENVISSEAHNQLSARSKSSAGHGGSKACVQILKVEVELSLHVKLITEQSSRYRLGDSCGGLRPSIFIAIHESGIIPAVHPAAVTSGAAPRVAIIAIAIISIAIVRIAIVISTVITPASLVTSVVTSVVASMVAG